MFNPAGIFFLFLLHEKSVFNNNNNNNFIYPVDSTIHRLNNWDQVTCYRSLFYLDYSNPKTSNWLTVGLNIVLGITRPMFSNSKGFVKSDLYFKPIWKISAINGTVYVS